MRRDTSCLDRQLALFEQMLRLMHEQRRYLINADTKGLEEANRLLGELLERQAALHREFTDFETCADPETLAQIRLLAAQLREESRTNYLLACRGAQFLDFSISTLKACCHLGMVSEPGAGEDEPSRASRFCAFDQVIGAVDVRT